MSKKLYRFKVYGISDYILGEINGIMQCICQEDPLTANPYGTVKISGSIKTRTGETEKVSGVIIAVSTEPDRFNRFKYIIEQKYKQTSDFHFEVISE